MSGDKKGDILTLTIEELNSYGSGVAHTEDGRVVFVSGAVKGDTVTAEVIKVDKRYSVARLLEVITPSPDREEESFCNAPNSCGGCIYRHVKYEAEKEAKQLHVKDSFRRVGLGEVTVLPTAVTGQTKGYRNKVIYPISENKSGLVYGYYARETHKVIPCECCSLTHPHLAHIAKETVGILNEYKLPAYNEKTGKGIIRNLYMRIGENTGEVLLTLVVNARELRHEKEISARIMNVDPSIVGVLLNINEKNTNVVLGKDYRVLKGRDFIYDTLCGKRFKISAASFWQVNHNAAELLYNIGFEMAETDKEDTIIDLYCGIGSIGISAADENKRILGIEIVESAVECASENARLNGIRNASYISADAQSSEEAIGRVLDENPNALVILDPPRKGCGESLMQFLAKKEVKKILYISCNPETLARDAATILPLGYSISSVQPVDLFPRTGHVETVALLSRQKVTEHIYIDVNIADLPKTTRTTATYPEIKAYIKDKYGLCVSSLNIAQIKEKHGFEKRENYNKGKDGHRVPKCPPEKEKAIEDAFKHFGML